MLNTIDRYLIRDVLLSFIATVLVLLGMLLSHRLAGYLNQAASGLLARDAIFLLLGLQAVRFAVVLVPVAMLLAVMLSLGRMYRDNEMTALGACGLGPYQVYRALYWLGIPMAVLLAYLTLDVVPRCMALQYEIQDRARRDAELSVFRPGTFRELAGGQIVVYVGAMEGSQLRDVFVRSQFDKQPLAITTAARGHQEFDLERGVRYVVLEDGQRYEGQPGSGQYRSVRFKQARIRLDSVPDDRAARRRETLPTGDLLSSPKSEHVAEFHTRLSGPISLLVLLGVAPLLAKANPREGRYGRIVLAVLIYVVYFNLLGIGDAQLKSGKLWPGLGLWWAHLAMLSLCLSIAWWQLPRKRKSGRHAVSPML